MAETMLAAVFHGPGRLELEQRPVPRITRPDDVILRVGGVGICGSDLSILEGPHKHPAKPGVIFGHEFGGVVEQVGEAVTGLAPGDHVAVDQNPGCGRCAMCRDGYFNACLELFDNPEAPEGGWPRTPGQWWDGGMAKYIRVPAHYLYPISRQVPMWQVAAFEPLGVVLGGMNKVRPQAGETACVIGAGPIGLFAVALLRLGGMSRIIVSETGEARRRMALALGADIALDPREQDLAQAVRESTRGRGADIAVEAVGTLLPQALEVLAFRGRVMQVGIPASEITFRPFHIFEKEAQIFGSFLMGAKAPNDAVRILEAGLLPMERIVTHRFPLERVHEAIETARRGEGGKIIIEP